MGIFSSAEPSLSDVVNDALSPAFRLDVVGKKQYGAGLSKLAGEQAALLATLNPGERLQVIVPCFRGPNYEGLAILTQNRVFHFKKKMERQMALSHVADHDARVHSTGFVILEIKGRNYIPYSTSLSKPAFEEFMRNSLSFYISGVETAQHFIALLDGIRANPDAAV
jgi:hypothetical protein